MKVLKLIDCAQGDVVQFVNDSGLVSGQEISPAEFATAKRGHTKGIVVTKTQTKVKVLEFDGIGNNRFDGILNLSNMRHNQLVCKLDYILETDAQ